LGQKEKAQVYWERAKTLEKKPEGKEPAEKRSPDE
jgi:hypothetical protein